MLFITVRIRQAKMIYFAEGSQRYKKTFLNSVNCFQSIIDCCSYESNYFGFGFRYLGPDGERLFIPKIIFV